MRSHLKLWKNGQEWNLVSTSSRREDG